MPPKVRDYKKEYENFHGTEREKGRRAERNRDRLRAIRDGRAKKGDGKDVHHLSGDLNGGTRVKSTHSNRSFPRRSDHTEIRTEDLLEKIEKCLNRPDWE